MDINFTHKWFLAKQRKTGFHQRFMCLTTTDFRIKVKPSNTNYKISGVKPKYIQLDNLNYIACDISFTEKELKIII